MLSNFVVTQLKVVPSEVWKSLPSPIISASILDLLTFEYSFMIPLFTEFEMYEMVFQLFEFGHMKVRSYKSDSVLGSSPYYIIFIVITIFQTLHKKVE